MDASSEAEHGGGCSAGDEENLKDAESTLDKVSFRPTPLINPNDLNDRIEQGTNALKDMLIAHEITMNGDFRIQERPIPTNGLERVITDTIKRAFWDILRSELEMNPPRYDQALTLLEDVKIGLSNAVLPHQTKLIQNINEVLDSDVIRQQAEAGVLDFKAYAEYVLNMMLKLCASARDERIEKLQQCTDVVETFKGILETLDLMKLDLANTSLQLARTDIILHSIQYEKDKFNVYVKSREGLEDCLRYTKVWLKRHIGTPENLKTKEQVLTSAYLELLEWPNEESFPETMIFDKARIFELGGRVIRLITSSTIYTLGSNQVAAVREVASLMQLLQSNISTLMASVQKNEDFVEILPNLILQIIKDIKVTLAAHGHPDLSSEEENAIKARLEQTANPTHNVRVILKQRLMEYIRLCLDSARGPIGLDIPPGWQIWKNDLTNLAARFARLTIHNRGVFSEHYINIIEEAQKSIQMN